MSELLKNLNEEQLKAVRHTNGPLLIVAGAGTGKTTVITRRIAYLIEQKLAKPEEILALTFTEKASGEMEERVDLLLPLGYYDKWISTFHSFCERILKSHALDIGISNDFELLDSIKQWILVYKNFEKFDLDYYRPLGSPDKFIDALLAHFSRCKDELISPEEYLEYAQNKYLDSDNIKLIKPKTLKPKSKINSKSQNPNPKKTDIDITEIARLKEVANAFHIYQKLLIDNNFLDFGDLINYTLLLFKKRPKILEYYQQKFKYIMVDEFQDTNCAQFELVKMIAGKNNNLVVVGDDDQSIYKFRGASVSNILKFKTGFANAKEITLTQNYRSTQNILDLAYNFIQANNPDRLEVKLNIDKRLKSNLGITEGNDIEVIEANDLSGELNMVAKKILEIKNLKNQKESSWNNFAVLIRANSSADELLPVLESYSIPYTFLANKGLYKKPIIVDILAYMKLLDNGHNSSALYKILTLPKFHLEHNEISTLLEHTHKKGISFFDCLKLAQTMLEISESSKKKISNLLNILNSHSLISKTKNATEMFVEIVNDLGIKDKLKDETENSMQNRELLDQFYKEIENFEKQNNFKNLHEFVNFIELKNQAGDEGDIKFDPNQGPESVKVLTIHSAKGLEFEYVFVINLVDQRFPTREKKDSVEIPEQLVKDILPEGDFHLQEERRLFYVSITRAKKKLFLTWAKDYGGKTLKKPSRFLTETKLVPSEKVSLATGKVFFEKPKIKNNIYKKFPTSFSFSALNDFKKCPLSYKYKHYLKLPLRGSHHQSFGITIHKVFEEFLKNYKKNLEFTQTDLFGKKLSENPMPDFAFLEKLYEKLWIDDWYKDSKQKKDYRIKGQKMLKYFYENIKQEKPKPKLIESFFKLKLDGYDFVGKIDRADESKEGLVIIDYKTGKAPKEDTKIEKSSLDQLYVYQWACQEFLKLPVSNLKYWFLEENKQIPEKLADSERIKSLKSELLNSINEIVLATKANDFLERDIKAPNKHECLFRELEN